MSTLTQFDQYLNDAGPDKTPAALVIREYLVPVEGEDGVVFPPTFAAGDGFPGGYNIDGDPNGTNVCLIDTLGSQANRIEPIFADEKYCKLVPQITIQAGEKAVSLLEAGHRAGDALVRCSELQQTLQDAFRSLLKGDAEPLAKIAPTSFVFGVWDSRDTQAKLPRLVASTIRAFNVRELRRSAQYAPPVDYAALDIFTEEEKEKSEGDAKSPLAKRGFVHVPASASHGGVIASAGIRRDATLSLAALRQIHAGPDEKRTTALRRYILGLALVALTYPAAGQLRQGCLLVLNKSKPREFDEVYPTGERKGARITHEGALQFATAAAEAFGVGESRTVPFDKERAKRDVVGDGDTKKAKRTKGKDKLAEATDA